ASRRLSRENRIARGAARLARDEPRLDALALEERGDEIADLIVADGGEERRGEPEAARADAHVRGAAADVRVEAAHLRDRAADLVRVEIDAAAAHGEHVVGVRPRG